MVIYNRLDKLAIKEICAKRENQADFFPYSLSGLSPFYGNALLYLSSKPTSRSQIQQQVLSN